MIKGRRPLVAWIAVAALSVVVAVLIGSFVWRMLHPPISPLVVEDDYRSVIQVNVVNASAVKGAARTTMTYLRKRGFDVVEISGESAVQRKSHVLDRVGDKISALKIAQTLGVPDSLVITEIDSMLFVRATVILGADIETLEPFAE